MKKHYCYLIQMFLFLGSFNLFLSLSNAGNPVAAFAAVKTNPPSTEESSCCAYSLHFVNLYDESKIKKIRVSAMCETKICCAEGDEWVQSNNYPQSVEWNPVGSTSIPYGNAIEDEFLIWLDGQTSPHNLQIEWIDVNDNVVCIHNIEIYCDRDYQEEEDWTLYTQTTSLNDPNLFVFAAREEEEDDEGCDDDGNAKMIDCYFDFNITCNGMSTYDVSLSGPNDFDTYDWVVVSGPATPSIPSTQNPIVNFATSGNYVINLMAIGNSGQDTCLSQNAVSIPVINPDFTWQIGPILCGTNVVFTATGINDPAEVSSVSWSCVGQTGFPTSGNSVSYDFLSYGTFSVTVTILDIYGCSHSKTKSITLSNVCTPAVKVDYYEFCPCPPNPDFIKVHFKNQSTGGKCPVTFDWNFGDGQTLTTGASDINVSHDYTQVGCHGKTFNLKLNMKDSDSPACNKTVSIPVIVEPCMADFDTILCPDGKFICTGNMSGTWEISPALTPLPCSDFKDANGLRQKVCYKVENNVTYTIKFTGYCSTGGRCTVVKTIKVYLACCAKNDAARDSELFSAGGKDYKMKYKMVQRQLPLIHNIKVKTKLKIKKKIGGIKYWKGKKAEEIESSLNGLIYKCDGVCNCKEEQPVSGSTIKYNKTKAKYREDVGAKYRSRKKSIISTHRVVKSGTTVTKQLELGKDCDEFRWWLDWF